MQHYYWPVLLPILFLLHSLPLFMRVYSTTRMVIDEEFHLRQGLRYCNKRFDEWDPKITTFPGLYLVSLILNPFQMCTVFGLRLISLTAATVNIVLMYIIRLKNLKKLNLPCPTMAALDAATIASLPPLYFFSHLYYTDAFSLTMVLLWYLHWLNDAHLQAAIFAAAGILVRQSNIVWVMMSCMTTSLDIITNNYAIAKNQVPTMVNIFAKQFWIQLLTDFNLLVVCIKHIFKDCCYYIAIIVLFFCFLILNKSIVLGDKQAHGITVHLPQVFYFVLFTMIFSVGTTLPRLKLALKLCYDYPKELFHIVVIFILIVKYNTLVHPYLLADNRHYIFYVWQKFYGRYYWFKYAMCPIYLLGIIVMHDGLQHLSYNFKIVYYVVSMVLLFGQRLLELRYFLVPFVLYRLNVKPVVGSRLPDWLELTVHIGLNFFTFYLFFNKDIKWQDFKEPQKLIW